MIMFIKITVITTMRNFMWMIIILIFFDFEVVEVDGGIGKSCWLCYSCDYLHIVNGVDNELNVHVEFALHLAECS